MQVSEFYGRLSEGVEIDNLEARKTVKTVSEQFRRAHLLVETR